MTAAGTATAATGGEGTCSRLHRWGAEMMHTRGRQREQRKGRERRLNQKEEQRQQHGEPSSRQDRHNSTIPHHELESPLLPPLAAVTHSFHTATHRKQQDEGDIAHSGLASIRMTHSQTIFEHKTIKKCINTRYTQILMLLF